MLKVRLGFRCRFDIRRIGGTRLLFPSSRDTIRAVSKRATINCNRCGISKTRLSGSVSLKNKSGSIVPSNYLKTAVLWCSLVGS
jgi:hypothetical protein